MIVNTLYRDDYTYEELLEIGTRYRVHILSTVTDDRRKGSLHRFASCCQELPDGKYKIFYISLVDVINKAIGVE